MVMRDRGGGQVCKVRYRLRDGTSFPGRRLSVGGV